mgnify:CR=1 FL=1
MNQTLIRGAHPYGEAARDVLIRGDRIVEIAERIEPGEATEVIDARGQVLLPGLVDLHVHLREPGAEGAETVLTGSQAAARGGFTTIFPMANTSPVADTAGVVEAVKQLGDRAGYCDVRPIGAVTKALAGEHLAELGRMADSTAAVRVFSDDGHCVADPLLMRRALEYAQHFGGVIAQHAQDPRLTIGAQLHEGEVSAELGLIGWPWVAETSIIARDVMLAEATGGRLHVCHVSCRTSVEIIRWAKQRGISVTAEVTPHHLMLSHERVRGFDARYKVNPPLRTERDIEALREGVADGTIDIVATDHAPHIAENKEGEWDACAMGMVGMESALRVVHATLIEPGHIDFRDVARVMSENPARIGQAPDAGGAIEVGAFADLCLYDPSVPARSFDEHDLSSKSNNSPFFGEQLPGMVTHTLFRGALTLRDGVVEPEERIAAAAAARRDTSVPGWEE